MLYGDEGQRQEWLRSVGLDDLDMLRKSWVRSLRSANKSPNTLESYDRSVRMFLVFLAEPPGTGSVAQHEETPAQLLARMPVQNETDLRRDHAEAFIGHLLGCGSAATAVNRFAGLRLWMQWMVDQPDIDVQINPMLGMRRPTIPENPPPLVQVDQLRLLLGTCDPKTFGGLRDETIIRLLADTGIRVGELCGLRTLEVIDNVRVPCVDMDTESVYVMGKGRRPRTVAFGAKTATVLDRYLRARRKHRHRDLTWFWLQAQERIKGEALTENGVRSMLERRARNAGVAHLHPHRLRHTWADAQKRRGMDRGDLKNQGGWRSDLMVDRYGAAAETDRALHAHRRTSFGDDI